MTEILVLGTFHFLESPMDVFSEAAQEELDSLARKFLPFQPDAVAVEAAIGAQAYIDRSYEIFQLEDLQNPKKMQTETLGEIELFGQRLPIPYRNEAVQIGYRLAKQLGHPKVYAVDEDMALNMDVLNDPTPALAEAMRALQDDMARRAEGTLAGLYRYFNGAAWSALNHSVYIQANAVSGTGRYAGAEMVASWYERNLKIFSNLQRLAAQKERVFVLFGAGHLRILKDLVQADRNLKWVDACAYLG